MNIGSRLPFCRWCKTKRVKRSEQVYCSSACYTASGRRRDAGKVNGKKWAERYWKRFALTFEEKYGHLDRVDQVRALVLIGMRRAYKKKHAA
jgi:hypothetical protein